MAELGLDAYRFSVSWPRVLPEGTGRVNEARPRLLRPARRRAARARDHPVRDALPLGPAAGARGRRRLARRARPRRPSPTTPRSSPRRLGDRVRHIATLNEPYVVADHGYRIGSHAPGRTEPDAALAAAHHLLVAHGSGWRRSGPPPPKRRSASSSTSIRRTRRPGTCSTRRPRRWLTPRSTAGSSTRWPAGATRRTPPAPGAGGATRCSTATWS